jgi:hypothetical protein
MMKILMAAAAKSMTEPNALGKYVKSALCEQHPDAIWSRRAHAWLSPRRIAARERNFQK